MLSGSECIVVGAVEAAVARGIGGSEGGGRDGGILNCYVRKPVGATVIFVCF